MVDVIAVLGVDVTVDGVVDADVVADVDVDPVVGSSLSWSAWCQLRAYWFQPLAEIYPNVVINLL